MQLVQNKLNINTGFKIQQITIIILQKILVNTRISLSIFRVNYHTVDKFYRNKTG